MGQILKKDKIGTLSHNAGVITLASGILTIGGQQYSVTNLTRTIATDITMVANTRYQIYAVVVAGVPVLRLSANENSSGPIGFTGWKLVGSFYSNGNLSFGSFVNIVGIPSTNTITYTPVLQGFSLTSPTFIWWRSGELLHIKGVGTTASPAASEFQLGLPIPFVSRADEINLSIVDGTTNTPRTSTAGWANNGQLLIESSVTYLTLKSPDSSSMTKANGNAMGNGIGFGVNCSVRASIFSNTAIEDL